MDAAHMLANLPLFDDIPREDIEDLVEHLVRKTFKEGEAIFAKGDPGTSMFLVAGGTVAIQLQSEGGAKVIVKEVHIGQYFGELALFDAKPRSASAIAKTDCEVLELSRATLHEHILKSPRIALAILAELSERLRETNEMVSARAAKDVNKEIDEKATFGNRIADRVAEVAGSWTFILSFIGVLVTWMAVNSVALSKALLHQEPFDPFPFIFFNLILSIVAAFQGPVIMMSQNRQSLKDRAQAETDFRVNLKNELGIEMIQRSLAEVKGHVQLLQRAVSAPTSSRLHADRDAH
jgi:uncharacterized membrane protein